MDANDPKVLFAGTWEVVMHTWAMFSGGAGSGVYVLARRRQHLARMTDAGLPKSPRGEDRRGDRAVELEAHVRADPDANQGSLWRSDDGGETVEGGELGPRGSSVAPATTSASPSIRRTISKCSSPTAASTARSMAA